MNRFSPGCCCSDCVIIEQESSQSGVSPVPHWDSTKWIQDAGTWTFTAASGGSPSYVETASSNAVLRCANLFAAGTTITGPNVRVRISGGNPGDQFYIWWHDGSAIYQWQVTHGDKCELSFDGVGVQATVIGNPVDNKSSVTTWASSSGDSEYPWDFTGWGVLSVQQCLQTDGGNDRIGRCSASTNAGSSNSTGEVMIEPAFLADVFRTRAANSWGIGTGTVSGTIKIEWLVAYNPSIRDDIDYWFDWLADDRPLELLPFEGTSPNEYDNAWLATSHPGHCNTSGPRSREIAAASNPIVPESWLVEPGDFSMLPSGSSCTGSLTGCVVDMGNSAFDYVAQPGVRGGSPLTDDVLVYRWFYHNTSSTWDIYSLRPNVGCDFAQSKVVYRLEIGRASGSDADITVTLLIRTFTYAGGGVDAYDSEIAFVGTITADTDLTTITDLELFFDSAAGTECATCAEPSPDLTGMSFTITAL
jgi:hypothetical protein